MIFGLLRKDFRRKMALYNYSKDDSIVKVLFKSGSLTMILYRIMWVLQKRGMSIASIFPYKIISFFCHCLIGRKADFGPGFVIMHTFGIVINSSVRGGDNITIQHGVTIGENRGKSPILGSDIYIGAGAKIFGGIRVGSNVKVGANSVIFKDVPNDVTMSGVPATVVKKNAPSIHIG